jgi:hypothetical protein
MTIAAFLALAALILAIAGLVGNPRWPWATSVAVLLLSIAVMIVGFGGKISIG